LSLDTCNLTMRIHPSHQAAVVDAFGVEPAECHQLVDRPRPLCVLVFDDVQPDRALGELARQGMTFDGSHGDGANYPGRLFAAHGGELAAVEQPFSVVSVPIDVDTLRVDEAALRGLRAYKRLHALTEEDFDREPPLDVQLAALHLEEAGNSEPWHRLRGSISLAGRRFHVEAVAVQDDLSDEHLAQEPLADDLVHRFALVSQGFSADTGFQTLRLPASDGQHHDYALFIHPHER
jgi:hypothetical protein